MAGAFGFAAGSEHAGWPVRRGCAAAPEVSGEPRRAKLARREGRNRGLEFSRNDPPGVSCSDGPGSRFLSRAGWRSTKGVCPILGRVRLAVALGSTPSGPSVAGGMMRVARRFVGRAGDHGGRVALLVQGGLCERSPSAREIGACRGRARTGVPPPDAAAIDAAHRRGSGRAAGGPAAVVCRWRRDAPPRDARSVVPHVAGVGSEAQRLAEQMHRMPIGECRSAGGALRVRVDSRSRHRGGAWVARCLCRCEGTGRGGVSTSDAGSGRQPRRRAALVALFHVERGD